MRSRTRHGWHKYINGVTVSAILVAIFVILPLYWMVINSFQGPLGLTSTHTQFFPSNPTTVNYKDAFQVSDFGVYFRNSLIVTLIATALVLVLGTLAGYALGRLPMRGKFSTMVILLMISVFPAIALIAPLYLLERRLNLLNSFQGLIIPYVAFNLPFAIWILRNYFLGIPKEMEETGRIDGPARCARCGRSCCRRHCPACSPRASSASRPAGPSS